MVSSSSAVEKGDAPAVSSKERASVEKEFISASIRARNNGVLLKDYLVGLNKDVSIGLEDIRKLAAESDRQEEQLAKFDPLLKLFSLRIEGDASLPEQLLKLLEDNLYDRQVLFKRVKEYFGGEDRLVNLRGEISGLKDAKMKLRYRLLNFQRLSNLLKDYLAALSKVFTLRFILNEIEKERAINREDGGNDPERAKKIEIELIDVSRKLKESLLSARQDLPEKLKKINTLLEKLESHPGLSDSEEMLIVNVRDGIGSVFNENYLLREELVNFLTERAYTTVAKRLDDYYSTQYHFNFGVSDISLFGYSDDTGVMLNRRATLPVGEFFLRMFAQQLGGAVKHGA